MRLHRGDTGIPRISDPLCAKRLPKGQRRAGNRTSSSNLFRKLRENKRLFGGETLYIEPGSPWESGYNESFNGKLRDERLNGKISYSLSEASIII